MHFLWAFARQIFCIPDEYEHTYAGLSQFSNSEMMTFIEFQ